MILKHRKIKVKSFTFSILIVVLLSACKKDLADVNVNYEGTWYSENDTFPSGDVYYDYFIIEGSNGVYGELCQHGASCGNYFEGKALLNKKQSKVIIGERFKSSGAIVLDIDKAPYINSNGKWECVILGTSYIKQ